MDQVRTIVLDIEAFLQLIECDVAMNAERRVFGEHCSMKGDYSDRLDTLTMELKMSSFHRNYRRDDESDVG
jgi:hypothetical protein